MQVEVEVGEVVQVEDEVDFILVCEEDNQKASMDDSRQDRLEDVIIFKKGVIATLTIDMEVATALALVLLILMDARMALIMVVTLSTLSMVPITIIVGRKDLILAQ